jgi:hypothetical protein
MRGASSAPEGYEKCVDIFGCEVLREETTEKICV